MFCRKGRKKDKHQKIPISGAASSKTGSKTHSTRTSISEQPPTRDLNEDQIIITSGRELLLMIQNDKSQAYAMRKALSDKRITSMTAMSNFLYCLSEMVEYSKMAVTIPYENRQAEIDTLCGSIFLSQKLQKSIKKIQGTLDEVKANHR